MNIVLFSEINSKSVLDLAAIPAMRVTIPRMAQTTAIVITNTRIVPTRNSHIYLLIIIDFRPHIGPVRS